MWRVRLAWTTIAFMLLLVVASPQRRAPIQVTFGGLLERLESEAPIGYPISVDLGYRGEEWGVTDWTGEDYVIRINGSACPAVVMDTLLEEYAHILVWDAIQEDDHGPLWGVAYARCVRIARR